MTESGAEMHFCGTVEKWVAWPEVRQILIGRVSGSFVLSLGSSLLRFLLKQYTDLHMHPSIIKTLRPRSVGLGREAVIMWF